jgi:hypothetical protein
MQVVEEAITVLRDSEEPGVTLVMGGFRIALTTTEARALAGSLGAALGGAPPQSAAPAAADAGATIAANVRDQVISWARIAEQVLHK